MWTLRSRTTTRVMNHTTIRPVGFVLLALLASACDSSDGVERNAVSRSARVDFSSPPDTTTGVTGTITLTEREDELRLEYAFAGLAPGRHGLHVHENASCGRADFDRDGLAEAAGAAGGHYDPLNTSTHGLPSETDVLRRHFGDLGNVTADEDGRSSGQKTIRGIRLEGMVSGTAYTFLEGRSMVVHTRRDDGRTQPDGDSGGRAACGVIEETTPQEDLGTE